MGGIQHTNPSTGGGGGAIETPKVYYVETTGNDGTAVPGDPSKPYSTLDAAYQHGVATGSPFVVKLGVGSWYLNMPVGSNFSFQCKSIHGCGAGADENASATRLYISSYYSSQPPTSNSNGENGDSILGAAFYNLYLFAMTSGRSVIGDDGGGPYTAGNGGSFNATCYGCTVSISCSAGGDASPLPEGSVIPGFPGDITVKGSFRCLGGWAGTALFDGGDLVGATFSVNTLAYARCSYSISSPPTTDMGGNAAH